MSRNTFAGFVFGTRGKVSARRAAGLRRLVPGILLVASGLGASPAHADTLEDTCQGGVFCAWAAEDFRGPLHRVDPRTTPLERCIGLPAKLEASSFVNRTGHPVTVYQDGHCATEADFKTYPNGTYVPTTPYVARAIKIWTH